MKVVVYVDGYNLYYGALKHTKYKWLDLIKLFEGRICSSMNISPSYLKIKFFTANILGSVSPSPDSVKDQMTYHNALLKLYPQRIEIIKGKYSKEIITAKLEEDIPGFIGEKVKVLKLEEKQTDVNIALEMYRDATKKNCDYILLCSVDTDILPALSALSEDYPQIHKGIVYPIKEGSKRAVSREFQKYCEWTWKHLSNNDLANSQLPQKIPTQKKPIIKPKSW